MNGKKVVVIDGNSLINRAYYALPPLSTRAGMPTNAVYGFITMLFKILEDQSPDYISIAFDKKAPTFRHKEFEGYKAERKGMPDELAVQVPTLKELLDCLEVNRVEIEGYEADDIIGTLSKYCEERGLEVFIVTGDRDALQLVSKRVKVIYTKRGVSDFELYDLDKIREIYGINPERLVDLKGLMGDKSDSIPGVPGIGEKTALKLLKEYGSLERVLDNIGNMGSGRIRDNLKNFAHQALLSKKLAKIHRDIPIEICLEECRVGKPDMEKVLNKLAALEFNSLMERAKKLFSGGENQHYAAGRRKTNTCYRCFEKLEDVEKAVREIRESGRMAFEVVVSTDDSIEFQVYGISLAWNEEEGGYIPLAHSECSLVEETVFKTLKPVMESSGIEKYGHHLKQDIIALKQRGIELKNYTFDAEIFGYLLDPSSSSYLLEKTAVKYLGESIAGTEELLGKGKAAVKYSDIDMGSLCKYLADRVFTIIRLKPVMEDEIRKMGMEKLVKEIELPLVEVLADMELTGFKVDKDSLMDFSDRLERDINSLTREIYHLAGCQFNINSTKQLGEVLFHKLGLTPIKKTKTGYSTDAEVLEQLKDKHPVVEKVLEYRQLVKLKTTYANGLLKAINPRTGRVHSSFKQTVTATGRISSTEPNLQNIPVKLDLGRELRRVFVPGSTDYLLVDADYSQIELRVLAHISGDQNLIRAFKENQDIHVQTAAQVFGVAPSLVTPAMRNSAKAVNFGIIYGISDYGLSQNLRIPRKQAAKYIESYFQKYRGVKEYMEKVVDEGKSRGFVRTLMGRVRYLPEIRSRNKNVRSFGERAAMNTPIQGSAADIIKLAMIRVYRRLKEEGLKSRLVLQVHDELIVEAHRDEIERVKAILKESMEGAVELKVPLKVDMGVGESWYSAK